MVAVRMRFWVQRQDHWEHYRRAMHTFRIFFRDHAKLPTLGLEPQEGPKCWKGPKKSWFCLPSHLSLLTCSLVISFSIFEKKTTYCLWKIIKRPKRSWIWAKPFFFWKILRKTKRGGGWLCVSRLGCLSLRKVGRRLHNNIRSSAVLPQHEVGFFLLYGWSTKEQKLNQTGWSMKVQLPKGWKYRKTLVSLLITFTMNIVCMTRWELQL